jgi:hypothetical protein
MTVCDTDKIDFATLDGSNDLILSISDHLDWDEPVEHIHALQNKINTYIAFVESGEVYSQWPLAAGRKIRIRVIGKYQLNDKARDFYEFASKIVRDLGLDLSFILFDNNRADAS